MLQDELRFFVLQGRSRASITLMLTSFWEILPVLSWVPIKGIDDCLSGARSPRLPDSWFGNVGCGALRIGLKAQDAWLRLKELKEGHV